MSWQITSRGGGERQSFGMVPSPHNSNSVHSPLGATIGGPFRQQTESQASSLRVPSPRRSGDGTGRTFDELEPSGRLCVPPVQSLEHGSQEARALVELPSDPGGPGLAPQVLVQPTLGPSSAEPQGSASKIRSAVATRRPNVTSKRGLPPPSRVEALRRSVVKRGFSSKAASLIAKAKRPSTSTVYDAKWKIFTSWCLKRKVDPLRPCLLYTSPSPRDLSTSRMPSSA